MEMSWPKIGVETLNLRQARAGGRAALQLVGGRAERFAVISFTAFYIRAINIKTYLVATSLVSGIQCYY